MRIGAILSPHADWRAVARAADAAEAGGLDAIGLWDHYHAIAPDAGYVGGWSALGALAARTRNVRLVPMVLNCLHYELGVLAKESSTLSSVAEGRFELGIGAGDWKSSFDAWGRPFPPAHERVALLAEIVRALRLVWSGQPVSVDGEHITLREAICAPAPEVAPRIMIGAGPSRRLVDVAAEIADEINVYDDDELVRSAAEAASRSGRDVTVSVFMSWDWDRWPQAPPDRVAQLAQLGVERIFVSVMSDDSERRVKTLAELQAGSLTP